MAPKYFSVSDVMTFLTCREKWNLSSPNRQSLRHKATPRMYLTQGTALHMGMDSQVSNPDASPLEAVHAYLTAERETQVTAYEAQNGMKPWPQEMAKWDDGAELAEALTVQYFDHYGVQNPIADQGLEFLATEIPFKINISDIVNLDDAYFVGTFDGIAVDAHGNFWLVENKSYSAKPDLLDLTVHFQTTGYAVAWEMLTGTKLTGALYNGVAKKLIKEPRRLQDGALSTAVNQQTTLARYTSAMTKDGLSLEDPKYAKIINHLTAIDREGDTRFFYREKLYYNEIQIKNWFEEFCKIVHEMQNPTIYRTVPYNGCGKQGSDCWYRDVCVAKHTGIEDVDKLVEQRYDKGSYGTIQAVEGIESVMVTTVEELREALKKP